ncbi:MAG TPA: molybdopterin-dependent oxidoreductase, partial [Vicinamibacterales bacterium]|nr:molybdopterin-dependent oxidoreductase [Vicinamibacterales bacterium]
GSRRAASTDGYICGKVRRFDRRVYGEDRVLFPLVRKGAKGRSDFARVTWDEALDLIAARMREARDRSGAESILPFHYGGSNGLLTNDLEDARFFRRFGASRLARTVCAAPTGAAATAMYGKMAGVAYPDYEEARLIIVWGCNPSATGIHLVSHIKRAQKQGARLVVIDPRRTPLARHADLHLPVRPGADLPIALALIRDLFSTGRADSAFLAAHALGADELRAAAEPWTLARAATEAGVDLQALQTLADWYGTIHPAVIRCGWGQERNRNGGGATMAILALPAVAGKFGRRGGGYSMSNSAAWGITAERLIDVPQTSARVVNMNHLGRVLTDPAMTPPVNVLFVYNCNPLATMPDQNRVRAGLARDDLFTVVHEQSMTDTTAFADVVLPATTFLEHYDVAKGYGAYHLHLVQPVIAPVGEARSNQDLFRELGVRLGQAEADELGEPGALMDAASRMPDAIAGPLMNEGRPPAPGDGRPIQFVDVMPKTADGKIHLFPPIAESRPLYDYAVDPATDDYPLALISPASEHTISSTLAELRPGIAKVKIHPIDALARVIADGDSVRIFNALGEVHCEATVTPEVREGTLALPKGLWARSTFNGATATALVPDALTDLAGGACFNDARVQIEVLGRH